MARKIRILLLVLVVLLVCSLAIYCGRRVLTATTSGLTPLTMALQPRDFSIRIPAAGELQSSDRVTVAVPQVPVWRLRIASVVPDGRRVNKGDVLLAFDPSEIDLQLIEHRSNLDTTLHKITQGELASNVEKTDIVKDKKLAQLELDKINEFLPKDEQIFARRQIIEAQLDKDYTEKKIVFADARLQLKGKVYSLDEAILMLEKQQANSKVNQDQKALASLKLLAPASGIVVYNDRDFFFGGAGLMPGRYVYAGMTLFSLVDPGKMEAKCYVLEKDAGQLRTGQPVSLRLDPFPDAEFRGSVKSIDKLARPIERGSPVKYFQAIVSLEKNDPELMKPGVKLKAEILPGDLHSVLVVPRSAIVQKDSRFIAYVVKGPSAFEPVAVTLGQGDQVQVVVTDGLKPGQVLALNPPDVQNPSSVPPRGTAKPAQ